jgi:hypothetical protein
MAFFENFCPPRSYCPIVRGKAKSFLGADKPTYGPFRELLKI